MPLCVLALVLGSAFCAAARQRDNRLNLDEEKQQAIMAFFRDRLAVGFGEEEEAELPSSLDRSRKSEGILALFHEQRKFAQVEAEGESLADLCENLSREMARALWRAPGGTEALEAGVLKMDVVTERRSTDARLDMPTMENERHGAFGYVVREPGRPLRGEARRTWFTPLDVLRTGQTGNLLQALYEAEGRTPPSRWRAERIRTFAFAEKEPGGETFRLYRGGPLLNGFSEDDMQPAFMAAAAWLMAVQDAEGRFLLHYDPFTRQAGEQVRVVSRRRREENEYSLLDHLRAIEPLIRVYEAVDDDSLLEAAERALRYAREQVMTIEAPQREEIGEEEERPRSRAEEICYIGDERDIARTTAVMLAAECRMAQAKREGATGLMRRLGRTLVHLVNEHGHMGFSVRDLMRGDTPHDQNNDVPGRTIYALSLLYQLDPREEWLTAATRVGLARLAPQGSSRVQHDPWDIIGMATLYRIEAPDSHRYFTGEYVRRRPEYIDMAQLREHFCTGAYVHGAGLLASSRRDRQWLIDRAQGKPLDPRHDLDRRLRFYWEGASQHMDFEGAFVAPGGTPQTMHTALRMRALAAVYGVSLIRSEDDLVFRQAIRQVAKPVSRFLARQQYTPASTFFFDDPEVVQGAFRESPSQFNVRMATTAETILALMEALKVMSIDDAEAPEAHLSQR